MANFLEDALDAVITHWAAPLSADVAKALEAAARARGASKALLGAIAAAFEPANVCAAAAALAAPARAHRVHDALALAPGQQSVLVNGHKINVGGEAPPFLAADFALLQVRAPRAETARSFTLAPSPG